MHSGEIDWTSDNKNINQSKLEKDDIAADVHIQHSRLGIIEGHCRIEAAVGGDREATPQTENNVSRELDIALNKAMTMADDTGVYCSDTASTVKICSKLLPRAS